MSALERSLKPTLLLTCGRSAAFAVTFLIPVILVRTFDRAGFGSYKQLFLIYSTVFSVMQFGMAESLYYFLPHNPKSGGRLAANATAVLGGLGAVTALGLTWQAARIAQWLHNPELEPVLPWLGLYAGLSLAGAGFEIVMISRKRYGLAALTIGISELLRAALFVIPTVVTGELRWLLLGGILFACIRLTAAGVFALREFPGGLRPDYSLLRRQLAYALPFQAAVLVETLQVNFHQYAVSYRFDAATFAIYAVGCLQIPASELLAAPAANVMMVRMSEEIHEGRTHNVPVIWHDTTRKLLYVLLPLTGLFIASAHDLILLLYTDAYRASVPIFGLWAVATAFQALPTDSVLRVYADTRAILALGFIRLAMVVSLVGLSISKMGLAGPVLVMVGVTLVAKTVALARIGRLMSVGFRRTVDWKTAGHALAVTVASCVVATGVRSYVTVSHFKGLALVGCVYAACCGIALAAQWKLNIRTVKTCVELPESSV